MKYNQGQIRPMGSDDTYDIIVDSGATNFRRDMLIGIGITLGGVIYTAIKAFKNGSSAYEQAEYSTFKKAGLLNEIADNISQATEHHREI